MPLSESDIKIANGKMQIVRWAPKNQEGEIISEVIFRFYNAAVHKEYHNSPLMEQRFSRNNMEHLINNGLDIDFRHIDNQPLLLTIQENYGEEMELAIPVGKPYELYVSYYRNHIGPKPRRTSWFKQAAPWPEVIAMEIEVPTLPNAVEIPVDLLCWQLKFDNGKIYRLQLPGLHMGVNRFCYQEKSIPNVQRGNLAVREDLRNIFKLVRI